jgi:hypothetical protein
MIPSTKEPTTALCALPQECAMIWEIIFHEKFEAWFFAEEPDLQDSIAMVLDILEIQGASLGRPYVDTIKGSAFTNMKELRVQHDGNPYRILFAFDPQRRAVLLIGGNKRGDKRWYEVNIPIADRLFVEYLEETNGGELLLAKNIEPIEKLDKNSLLRDNRKSALVRQKLTPS